MKSKRIACIAMAGLMAASLAGCGGSDSDNKDTAEATKATTEAAVFTDSVMFLQIGYGLLFYI